jgi:hypothetical protein
MPMFQHTNDEAAKRGLPLILGEITEREHGKYFEYGVRPADGCDFAEDAMHVIAMSDGSTRYARVLKTVAWVVINEADDGSPVWERWELKANREYDTSAYHAAR